MKKELILPANCKGAFVAYKSETQYVENEVWDEDEDDYVTEENEIEVNTNGIIMFQMEALTNVSLKYYGNSFVDFYWNNCLDCIHRLYDDCIGGINVHRNNKCKKSISIPSKIEKFIERDIPEHLMMFDGYSYYFFVEHDGDEVVSLSLSNVHLRDGSWCTGQVKIDRLNVNETYQDFWNCTRNGDYTPSLYIDDEIVEPTLEQLLTYWSVDKLVFTDNCDNESYKIDLDSEWLYSRDERHYLDFSNNSYYFTDIRPSNDSFIELENDNYYLVIE